MGDKNKCNNLVYVALGGLLVILGLIFGAIVFGHPAPQVQIITLSTFTKTMNFNSDSGILSLNITYTNPNTSMDNIEPYSNGNTGYVFYQNYTLNSATEELPNGEIIIPAQDYALKQLEISLSYCRNDNYYLGTINHIVYEYGCLSS